MGIHCVHYIEQKDCTAGFDAGGILEIPDCRVEGPSSSTLYGGGGCAQHQEDSVDRRGEGPSSSTLQYMVVVDVRNTSRRILLAVEGRAPLVVLYMVS